MTTRDPSPLSPPPGGLTPERAGERPTERPAGSATPPAFSEKGFYLEEFYAKTLAIAVPAADLRSPAPLLRVLDELTANGTNVVVLTTERGRLEPFVGPDVLAMTGTPRFEGTVWRRLRASFRLGIVIAGSRAFAPACREAALRLGIPKLVWIDRDGGLVRPDGERISFVHLEELRGILAGSPWRSRRGDMLREVEAMLAAGVPAVNVCSLAGLHDELFTYNGSGTLFTQERYVVVRKLGIDDFDAASDLIARGTEEGYLAPRSEAQLDAVLASGFGAFVEGRHLAGIGSLLLDVPSRCAEVASLYTLTRFLGEGVGAHLVAYALERARELGLAYVYACTTSERVRAFFERHGFCPVSADGLPASKWRGYDAARRASLTCLRRDVS